MANTDMTQGSVGKLVIKTAIPMVVAQVINMLYNVVDRMFVGRIDGVGAIALGGIGIYMPISIIIMAFALWIGAGGAPKAAIAMGKGEKKEAEQIMGCCVIPILVLGAALTGAQLLLGRQLLPLFGATATNLPYALGYMNIIAVGTIFSMISTGLNTFINTQGKTLTGMMSIAIGAVVNLVLDAVFIFGLGMGVKGAALATVIGQMVSCIWVVGFLVSKKSALRLHRSNLKPEHKILGGIMALGLSAFITTAVESAVTIVLNFALKKYGALAFAGFSTDGSTLAISINTIITMASSFILMPIMGFTQGVQPVISYNYGAKRFDRAKKAIRVSCIICTTYGAALCTVLMLAPQLFAGMFTVDPEVIHLTQNLLRVYVSAMMLCGIQTSLQQSFAALGMAKYSIGVAAARKILYIPLLLILPALAGASGSMAAIYAAEPISTLFATLVTVVLFFATRKTLWPDQKRSLVKGQPEAA